MRKKLLATFTAILLGILGVAFLPGDEAEALRKKPGCGECWEGTFNSSTYACTDSHTNCTECTVCG